MVTWLLLPMRLKSRLMLILPGLSLSITAAATSDIARLSFSYAAIEVGEKVFYFCCHDSLLNFNVCVVENCQQMLCLANRVIEGVVMRA